MTLADQLQKMLAAHPDDPRTPQGNALHHRFMVLEAGDYTGMETLCSEAIEAIEQMEISLSDTIKSLDRARSDAGEVAVMLLQNDHEGALQWARDVTLEFKSGDGAPRLSVDVERIQRERDEWERRHQEQRKEIAELRAVGSYAEELKQGRDIAAANAVRYERERDEMEEAAVTLGEEQMVLLAGLKARTECLSFVRELLKYPPSDAEREAAIASIDALSKNTTTEATCPKP